MLNEVEKIILGERNESLTSDEIKSLFEEKITPEFNLILYKALEKKYLDSDVVVLQIIPKANKTDFLIPIGFCLRFGTNPNMYLNDPDLGPVHILGYIYKSLMKDDMTDLEKSILNTIVLMFIIKGSKGSMYIFDKTGGKIKDNDKIIDTMNVNEWLNLNGYDNIVDKGLSGDPNVLKEYIKSFNLLSILLDRILYDDLKSEDIFRAIKAHDRIIFDSIPITNDKNFMDYKTLEFCVDNLNSFAFEKLIEYGQTPSYILINKILIAMSKNKNIVYQELEKMLLVAVENGIQIDVEQYNIVKSDSIESFSKKYEQPYWTKICKITDNKKPSVELKKIALSLNINPNNKKSVICDQIKDLVKADKETLKESNRKRQQMRMNSTVGNVKDFISDKNNNFSCANKKSFKKDPLDYNDIDISYYKDEQGSVWCFNSDFYESLLESGMNPHIRTYLPESFKEEIKYKLEILKKYNTEKIDTFSDGIDNLTMNDKVNERMSKKYFNFFLETGEEYGFNRETLKNLSKESLTQAFNKLNYNFDLISLTNKHALLTTGYVIVFLDQHAKENVKKFFTFLEI